MKITRRQLVARVRHWRTRLNLDDWDIYVSIRNPGDGDDAECDAEPQYKRATIRFNLDQVPADELDGFVAHELCHCPLEKLGRLALAWAGDDPIKQRIVLETEDEAVTHFERVVVALAKRQA